VLENEDLSLWYHPRHGIVHHQLHKVPSSAALREMLTKGAELIEKWSAKKWLSDDTKNTVIRPADGEWGDANWAPRVIRAGFAYWGIVLPLVAIGKLNMQRFASEYRQRGVTVHVVDNAEAAFSWLKER
jgi:hypothetical protein